VTVRFRRLGDAKSQHITTEIQAVSKSGQRTKPHKITVGYYPKELYAASGQTAPNWVIVQNTDLALARTVVEDWIVDLPPEEDRAYAQERWGNLVEGRRSEYEKAQALARSLITALKPHAGVPSDLMRTSAPFQQFERAISGQDRVWCGNHAAIFSWACNALGVPARRIGMNHPYGSDGDHNLLLAEGHSTTEVFDETLNRWVWIDLTFSVLGVHLAENGPVNMAELVQLLNDGGRLQALTVVEFDPASGEARRVAGTESGKKAALFHYFKRDQQFRYTRRA
jgi:transglutaminase-like putative cysteine protease